MILIPKRSKRSWKKVSLPPGSGGADLRGIGPASGAPQCRGTSGWLAWLIVLAVICAARPWPTRAQLAPFVGGAGPGLQPLWIQKHDARVTDAAFSPDGRWIASVTEGVKSSARVVSAVRLWNVETHAAHLLQGHTNTIYSVQFDPADSSRLLTASGDGRLGFWNLGGKEDLLDSPHGLAIAAAYRPPGGLETASAWSDGAIELRKLPPTNSPRMIRSPAHENPAIDLAFDPSGHFLAAGFHSGVVIIWDLFAGFPSRVLTRHSEQVNRIRFSPDGTELASASKDGTVGLWRYEDNSYSMLPCAGGSVISVAFSADGAFLLAGCKNGDLEVWDVRTHNRVRSLHLHDDEITEVVFSPDGKYVLSASHDRTFKLWDANDILPPGAILVKTAVGRPGVSLAATTGAAPLYSAAPDQWTEGNLTIPNVKPGTYVLTATLRGYVDAAEKVTVRPGEIIPLMLNLQAVMGSLTVTTNVDGAAITVTPETENSLSVPVGLDGRTFKNLSPGDYVVEVTADGYEPFSQIVTIRPGWPSILPVTLQAKTGSLTVSTNVDGASITLEGESLDAPISLTRGVLQDGLKPGTYSVVVSADGYQQQSQNVNILPGAPASLSFTLNAKSGGLTITTNVDGATISVNHNGERIPPDFDGTFSSLSPGEYVVEVSAEGYQASRKNITIQAGQTSALVVSLQRDAAWLQKGAVANLAELKFDQAISGADQLLDIEPDNSIAHSVIAIALLERSDQPGQDDQDRAEQQIQSANRTATTTLEDAFANNAQAVLEILRKQWDPAGAALERARALLPGLALTHWHLAELNQHRGRYTDAEREYRLAIQYDPHNGNYKLPLATLLAHRHSWAEARSVWNQAKTDGYAPITDNQQLVDYLSKYVPPE